MKTIYFDCIAGASGDMILGALIDAGLSLESLKEKLDLLHLNEFELTTTKVKKNGFSATKFDVIIKENVHERHFSEIKKIIDESGLSEKIKKQSLEIFWMLCEVEAGIHNSSPDKVHLHELGGTDTIVDVVGTLAGLELLGIEKVYASPLPIGCGFVKGAHGKIPLPAPATAALLNDIPVYGVDIEKELITPTGAVLLKYLAHGFGKMPSMNYQQIGYGAGTRDMEIPNIIRVFIGDTKIQEGVISEQLVLLQTNIDDQNPEFYDFIMEKLFERGALDVYLTSLFMKKNRPGIKLSILCQPDHAEVMKQIVFKESGSLGIKEQMILRESLPREIISVKTQYGNVNVKIARFQENVKIIPEYEDCKKLAKLNNLPVLTVYDEAKKVTAETMKM